MSFTVKQLKEALDAYDIPDDAIVMLEIGNYVKAAENLMTVSTPEYPHILAITSRKDELVN